MTRLHNMLHAAAGTANLEETEGNEVATCARNVQTLLRRNWPIAAVLFMLPTTAVSAQELAARDRST